MIGDRIEVLDELHLASASILSKDLYNKSEILEYFLVKPVIKQSLFGKQELVGYVEAITGIRVCNAEPHFGSDYLGDPVMDGYNFYDAELGRVGSVRAAGDIIWDVNSEKTASEICTEGNIERYFRFADFDIEGRINNIREQSRLQKEEIKVDIFKTRTRSKSE